MPPKTTAARMRVHEFKTELWLPSEPEQVFPFFTAAGNLDAITPPWLRFQIVTTRPIDIREGTLIDYKLRVRGFPLHWRSVIRDWRPPHCFVDEQLRGPYRLWIHTHAFEPLNRGTIVRDTVQYAVPLNFILHPLFVRRDIERIFAFRQQALRAAFVAGNE